MLLIVITILSMKMSQRKLNQKSAYKNQQVYQNGCVQYLNHQQ